MIVTEVLNDLFSDRSVTLTKQLEKRFQTYLNQYKIKFTAKEYLLYLESHGYISMEAFPDQKTIKIKRLHRYETKTPETSKTKISG